MVLWFIDILIAPPHYNGFCEMFINISSNKLIRFEFYVILVLYYKFEVRIALNVPFGEPLRIICLTLEIVIRIFKIGGVVWSLINMLLN